MIKLKKGLDLPIEGQPQQKIEKGQQVSHVALIGDDVVGMKPTMMVKVGDTVQVGQEVYADKKTGGVKYTAPAAGEVVAINRGARRKFESLVIKVDGDSHASFEAYKGSDVTSYDEKGIKELLIESGMWPSIRRRPFSKVANPEEKPKSIFITAIDTHPLAADVDLVVKENEQAFKAGLKAVSKLAPKSFLCVKSGSSVPNIDGVHKEEFKGPHPAGLVGTHIHYLDPVGEKSFVWHIGYQDVIAIGKLLETGQLYTQRVISLAGPQAKNPRLIKTRMGACLDELCKDEKKSQSARVVSGSVFGGRKSEDMVCYLGRFHNQVSLIEEGGKRELLGWHSPGFDKFSVKNIYVSKLFSKKFALSSAPC